MIKKLSIISSFFALISMFPVSVFAAVTATAAKSGPVRVKTVADFSYKSSDFAAAIVMDEQTKKILFSYNPDQPWVPASLTKLASALTFVDQKPSWQKVVAITKADEVGGGRLRVADGSTMTIQDLMYSSIVGSANNAATSFARLSGLGMTKFVQAMNKKVQSLGCMDTKFNDAAGMNEKNITTAADMLKIADKAFNTPEIQRPASSISYSFKILNTGELKTIKNTNQLLLDPNNGLWVTGGKTGYLEESMNNLVYRVRPSKNDKQRELVILVFGVPTRAKMFDVAERLAKWTWQAYDWSKSYTLVKTETTPILDKALVKSSSAPTVWYVVNGKKYILLDGVFLDLYFKDAKIHTLTDKEIANYQDARPYTFDDGTLVRSYSQPTVYLVQNGDLHAIISDKVFEALGYKWSEVATAPDFLLKTYAVGEPIKDATTDTLHLSVK